MNSRVYIVFGLGVLVLVFLLWQEVRRPKRARLFLRILAGLLAVGALVCLQVPVTYNRNEISGAREAVLLTEGYDADSLKQFAADVRVIDADTLAAAAADLEGVGELQVLGYGLALRDWKRMGVVPRLVWHAPRRQTGFVSVNWARRLRAGEPWIIQGSLFRDADKTLKVLLEGFGGILDSFVLKPGVNSFELQTVPAQLGRAVYRLCLLSGADTLEQEVLPVEVSSRQAERILFLAGAPDAENRFLADWLSRQGYALAMRTAISKDKFDKAWLNMASVGLDPIDASLLNRFDVVIADEAQLQGLGGGELAALRRQVSDRGLGLLIKGDSGAGHAFYREPFPLLAPRDSMQGVTIRDRPGTEPLVRDSLSRIIAARTIYGKGKLVYTVGKPSYSLMLAGNRMGYAGLWSVLVSGAIADEAGTGWEYQPAVPRVRESVQVKVSGDATGLHDLRVGDAAVYGEEDVLYGFVRVGVYWPERSGWQQSILGGRDSSWWYVWPAGDWKVQRRLQKWMDTRRFADLQGETSRMGAGQNPAGLTVKPVQVNRVWFFLIFLLAMIFLWVERTI